MDDLSLRQVSHDVLHWTSDLDVRRDVSSIPNLPGGDSLRRQVAFLRCIHRFAPEVRLHPDDPNLPSAVGWYLSRVRMRHHRPQREDVQVLDRGQVTVESLVSQSSEGQSSGSGRAQTQFFLEIWGTDAEQAEARGGNLASAEVYVHFRAAPIGGGHVDIQYWFFYPYNGFGPGHEGDWEHVTVRVTEAFEIAWVFFASHARESVWRYPGAYGVNALGHPIVYSAKGSHACYSTAGRQDRGRWYTAEIPPDDNTAEGGLVWRTWENIRLVGEVGQPLAGQEWVNYTGHWGEIGAPGISGPLVTSGPYGPAFQAWWDDDDRGNSPV